MKNLAIALLSILLFSQCAEKDGVKPKFDLTGTTWILKSGSGEASVTGDLNGNGRTDDDKGIYDSDYFFVSVESEIVFKSGTTLLISNKDDNIHEEMRFSISGDDEIKLESDDWGELYFILKVTGNDMILDWDKATFTKTYGRPDVVIQNSNIRYQLSKK